MAKTKKNVSYTKRAASAFKALSAFKRIVLVLLALIVLGLVLYNLAVFVTHTVYYEGRKQSKREISSLMSNVSQAMPPDFSEITDTGCDSRNSVGLATYVHCDMVGQMFWTSSEKSIKNELGSLNRMLEREGWRATDYANSSKAQIERSKAARVGEQSGSVRYITEEYYNKGSIEYDNSRSMTLYVDSFDDSKSYAYNHRVKELMKNGKIEDMSKGGYIYGIVNSKIYWSCRSGLFLSFRCDMYPQ